MSNDPETDIDRLLARIAEYQRHYRQVVFGHLNRSIPNGWAGIPPVPEPKTVFSWGLQAHRLDLVPSYILADPTVYGPSPTVDGGWWGPETTR